MFWAFAVLILGGLALTAAVVLAITTGIGFGTSLTLALGLFLVLAVTFLVAVWLTAWTQGSRFSRTRLVHQDKLLRRENHQLRRTVDAQQRRIEALERDLASLSARAASVPPARRTGTHPRVETREMRRTTGEYRLVNTPTYTPRGDTGPLRRATDTGLYQPARDTGTHPIHQTGRVPRPRNLPHDETNV